MKKKKWMAACLAFALSISNSFCYTGAATVDLNLTEDGVENQMLEEEQPKEDLPSVGTQELDISETDVSELDVSELENSELETSKSETSELEESEPETSEIEFPGDTLVYHAQDAEISAQKIEDEWYLFLPSTERAEAFWVECQLEDGSELWISGSQKEEGVLLEEKMDLSSVAVEEEHVWPVQLSIRKENTLVAEQKLNVMYSENISSMFITSKDKDNAGRDYVDAVKGNKGSGSMTLCDADGNEIYNSTFKEIKARGNSSYKYYPKKSYQIKLGDKASLIPGTKEHKTWILLAQYNDPLKIADKTWKDVANYLDDAYEPDETYTDLYYDGEYRGTYMISEKVQIDSERIDITDAEALYEECNENYGSDAVIQKAKNKYGKYYKYTEGLTEPEERSFLLEMNGRAGDEVNWFKLKSGLGINIKTPEYVGKNDGKYISEYVQEFENAIMATDENGNHTGQNPDTGLFYYDYADLDSLVRIYLLNSVSGYNDGFWRSLYMYKDTEGLMKFGPIWDMDLTLGTGWINPPEAQSEPMGLTVWGSHLIQIPSFRQAVRTYYEEHFPTISAALQGDSEASAQTGITPLWDRVEQVRASARMDYKVWPIRIKCAAPYAKYPNQTYAEYLASGCIPLFELWPEDMTFDQVADARIAWQREHDSWQQSYFGGMQTEHAHVYGAATDNGNGTHTRACMGCGEIKTEDCKKTLVSQTEPSASDMGHEIYECSVCKGRQTVNTTLERSEKFTKSKITYKVLIKDQCVRPNQAVSATKKLPSTVKFGGITYRVYPTSQEAFGAPPSLKATNAGYNSVKISWSKVKGADAMAIYLYDPVKKKTTWKANVPQAQGSYVMSGLISGKKYDFKVRAFYCDSEGRELGKYSKAVSAVPELGKLSSVSADRRSYNSVRLSWKAPTEADGVSIYLYHPSTKRTTWKVNVKKGTSDYTMSGLKTGQVYYFKMRSYKNVNGKKIYGAFTGTLSATPSLLVPKNFSVESSARGNAKLKWTESTGAQYTSIYLYHPSTKRTTWKADVKKGTSSYTFKKLTSGKRYYYRIRSYRYVDGKKVFSRFSNVESVEIQ